MQYLISGVDLQFEWEEVGAFVRQPDGSLFSWSERFHCYQHLIYGIVSHSMIQIYENIYFPGVFIEFDMFALH